MYSFLLKAFLIVCICTPDLYSQEFGRNKVQYEQFDFFITRTDHFDVYSYPEGGRGVRGALPMLERWYSRLSAFFGFSPDGRLPVILYASHPDFQQTNIIPGLVSQGTGGVTESELSRMVIPLTGINSENDHVLGHEMVHAFHFANSRTRLGSQGIQTVPLWFAEGIAEYLSLGTSDTLTDVWIRDAVIRDRFPSIADLELKPVYSPYRFGHSLWAYIGNRWGDGKAGEFFNASLREGMKKAAVSTFGISIKNLSDDWADKTRSQAEETLRDRRFDIGFSDPVLSGMGGMNLGPAANADGTLLAFFSQRDLFSLDLYIVETETGRVVRKITDTGIGSGAGSLSFLNSAGAFSPDSELFAFIVIDEGNSGINIVDLTSGRIVHSGRWSSVQAVLHTAWSPDGRYIAFSGISDGVSDLFLYDVSSSTLIRLTDDSYSDLQPDWSSDGSYLVFSTDRGDSSDTGAGLYSALEPALFELSTGTIRVLDIPGDADCINPLVAPDGKSVYFIAAFDGFPDIYRYFLGDESLYRITRVKTGVIGLTGKSAAMTLSKNTGRLFFNVFEDGGYVFYSLPESIPEEDDRVYPPELLGSGPVERTGNTGIVSSYLENPSFGLPVNPNDYPIEPYHPVLKLSGIGNLSLGVMFGGSGVAVYGNVMLLFSDFLKNHLLMTMFSIQGDLIKDFAGEIQYINRENRLNWGLGFSHLPYLSYQYELHDLPPGSDGESRKELVRITDRIYQETFSLLSAYPFSENVRLEGSLGLSLLTFTSRKDLFTISENTITSESGVDLPSPEPLYLVLPSISLVGDYSFSGFTSPVRGLRFRLDAEPVLGSLNFLSARGDLRYYLFSRPASLAFRMLHMGRYLGDSESDRIAPFFLGNPVFIRGYEPESFVDNSGRGIIRETGGALYESLFGTRAAVFKTELRIPIVGNKELGFINFPYLPVTLAGFFDAGVVWTGGESPLGKTPTMSAGGSVYVNLLGAMVIQIYYAYPFHRPDAGAHWGFLIGAGF